MLVHQNMHANVKKKFLTGAVEEILNGWVFHRQNIGVTLHRSLPRSKSFPTLQIDSISRIVEHVIGDQLLMALTFPVLLDRLHSNDV